MVDDNFFVSLSTIKICLTIKKIIMSRGSNTFLAFLVGVLFAPDKGKNTRDKLSFRLDKYKKKLEELTNELLEGKEQVHSQAKSDGEKVVHETASKAENLLNDVEELLNQIQKGSNA